VNVSYGSVTLVEVLWTVFAIPGFFVWFANLRSAQADLEAVRRLGVIDGRLVWAKFSVLKNASFFFIETGFLAIGITAMLQMPVVANPSKLSPTGWVMTFCLLSSSVLMTVVGLRWKHVSRYILDLARIRVSHPDDAKSK
jgi:hypothetical protein